MKNIAVLGSTGSIGTQTLDVVRLHPDMFRVRALACRSDIRLAEQQIREFEPDVAAVYDEAAAVGLAAAVADTGVKVLSGEEGLLEVCTHKDAELVVTGIVGMIGIKPTIAALCAGKDIALANKETLVAAGHIIMPLARKLGRKILPVDSEHSAIFQSLDGDTDRRVRRILLTASGGPFRGKTRGELLGVTAKEALAHPTWSMGPKVTIDSATMVNKGLELIEARWLFDTPADRIEVLIQPQSLIHSAVEYEDGSIIAQIGPADMRIPIQLALTWPEHIKSPAEPLDFSKISSLVLEQPDTETFRGIPLARKAIEKGGSMPVVFNAANEWANAVFRKGGISFLEIYDIIEYEMARHSWIDDPDVDEIFAIREEIDAHNAEKYGFGLG